MYPKLGPFDVGSPPPSSTAPGPEAADDRSSFNRCIVVLHGRIVDVKKEVSKGLILLACVVLFAKQETVSIDHMFKQVQGICSFAFVLALNLHFDNLRMLSLTQYRVEDHLSKEIACGVLDTKVELWMRCKLRSDVEIIITVGALEIPPSAKNNNAFMPDAHLLTKRS